MRKLNFNYLNNSQFSYFNDDVVETKLESGRQQASSCSTEQCARHLLATLVKSRGP